MDDHEFKSQKILAVLTESCAGKYYQAVEIVGTTNIEEPWYTHLEVGHLMDKKLRFSYYDIDI